MKKLMRKQNPAARLVALWMVFLMMLTPLLEHGGLPEKAKAADVETMIIYGGTISSFTGTLADDGSGGYAISDVVSSNVSPGLTLGTYCKQVQFSVSLVSGSLKYDNKEFNISNSTIRIYKGTDADALDIMTLDDTNSYANNVAVSVNTGDIFYAYASIAGGVDEDGASITTDTTKYVKIAKYTIAAPDITAQWANGAENKVVNSAQISTSAGSVINLESKNKGYYFNEDGVAPVDWSTVTGITGSPVLNKSDGTYYGFVVFTDDNPNGKTVVGHKSVGKVTLDTADPILDGSELYTNSGDKKTEVADDGSGNYCIDKDKASNLTLYFYVKDAHLPADGDTADVYINGVNYSATGKTVNGQYLYEITNINGNDWELAKSYPVTTVLEDAAGNVTDVITICNVYKIDKTPQATISITGDKGYSGSTLPTEYEKQTGNELLTLTAVVTSGYKIESVELTSDGTNSDTVTYAIVNDPTVLPQVATNGLYTYTFKFPFDTETKYEGLKLKVNVEGDNDLVKDIEGSYTYDKTAPTITYEGFYGVIDGKNYTSLASNTVDNVYYVDSQKTYLFFDTTDTDIEKVELRYDGGEIKTSLDWAAIDGDFYNGDHYYIATLTGMEKLIKDYGKDGELTLTAYAVDKLGNASAPVVVPITFAIPDTTIKMDEAKLYDNNNNEIKLPVDSIINKKYKLNVKVSSGYEIEKITVTYNGDEYVYDSFDKVEGPDAVTKRYTVTTTIDLPKVDNVNELLNNITVTATDSEDYTTTGVTIGTLFFDQTNPVITYTDASADKNTMSDIWYGPDFQGVIATITPGPEGSSPEADIDVDSVSYDISNSAVDTDNKTGATEGVVGDTPNAVVTVTVPESKDANGTKITFKASDNANNSLDENNEINVKVDKTEPSITEVLINGSDYTKYNMTYPKLKIKAEAEDNLTLGSLVFVIEQDEDGVWKQVDSHTQNDFNADSYDGKVVNDSGEYTTPILDDGDYRFVITVKDKANNSAEQIIPFTVNGQLCETHTIVIGDKNSSNLFGEDAFGESDAPTISDEIHTIKSVFTSSKEIKSAEIYVDGVKYDKNVEVKLNKRDKNTGLYSGTLNFTLGAGEEEKTYKNIYLKVKDEDSKDSDETSYLNISLGDFIYDNKEPEVTCKGLYIYDETAKIWSVVTTYADTYTIDVTKNQKYAYVFDVKEGEAGIDEENTFVYYANSTENEVVLKKNEGAAIDSQSQYTGQEYIAEMTTKDILTHFSTHGSPWYNVMYLEYFVNATDKAGNAYKENNYDYNAKKLIPVLLTPDGELLASAILQYDEDTKVDIINPTTYINKASQLVVTAKSAHKIETMDILYVDADGKEQSYYGVAQDVSDINEHSDENKIHSATYTFDIPKDISTNELINNMMIKVTDANPDLDKNTYKATVGTLLYDQTNPIIVNNNSEETDLSDKIFTDDPIWYNSYELDATVRSGAQVDAADSSVETATYTIQGSVDGDIENQPIDIQEGVGNVKFDVPESADVTGTTVTFTAKDMAGNEIKDNDKAVIRVDKHNPTIDVKLNDGTDFATPVAMNFKLDMSVNDNLALGSYNYILTDEAGNEIAKDSIEYESHEALRASEEGVTVDFTYQNEKMLTDGKYILTVDANDKAGNPADTKVVEFVVDGTTPVVNVKILSGTMGGKAPSKNFDGTACDRYYRSDVMVQFSYKDNEQLNTTINYNGQEIKPNWSYDNNQKLWYVNYPVSTNGSHSFDITAVDTAGNPAEKKAIGFILDKKVPIVNATLNGGITISDTLGQVMLTSNATITASVSDDYEDVADLNYQTIVAVPDQPVMTSEYLKTTNRSFNFAEEADYTFNIYSVDMAGNISATKTATFRIDKTAPNINVGGIGANGTSSTPVNISFNMQEAFWSDASGSVRIYRQGGDGALESLMEEFDYRPSAYNTSITRNITESGVYRVEFEASDRVGHTAETEMSFTVDLNAPTVTLTGVENYDVTDQTVSIESLITDEFYASKKVSVTGNVTDKEGKVSPISITNFNAAVNPTTISESFTSDGIYDLTITATDIAGNSTSQSVHFTIDKSSPTIGDLSAYDGTILTEFVWDIDLDELVSDLTVCDVHMYLNGKEYNGEDEIADGSYVLLITAEDDLGHKTEKSVEFVLDTKDPVFIVTGVEDGEVKEEPYQISVSLQLEEDTLTSVTLNGEVVTVVGNVANINITEKGDYILEMTAIDEAGNQTSDVIEFRLGQEETASWLWLILLIIGVILALIIIIIIAKRRKKDEKNVK